VAAAATAAVAALTIGWWVYGYVRPAPVHERPLGIDQQPAFSTQQAARPAGTGGESFSKTTPVDEKMPGLWPWFRGPARDNIADTGGKLNFAWGSSGPPVLWSVELGEGYAAPAVRRGRVYVIDYDHAGQADAIRCFSLADGTEVWRRSYPVVVKRNHGMSRTIPAVTDKYVVTLGPKCHLTCVDALTGALIWQHDLVADFGVTVPEWYAGQCPLIDGNRVVIGTGGPALLTAFDLASGKPVWKTPNPRGWTMTHSSVLPITVGGIPQYVWCGSGGVVGVAANDGRLLWENLDWVISTATVPTPVWLGDNRILLTGGYDSGAMLLQLNASGGKLSASVTARLKPQVLGSDQQTPVFYKGHIYAVKPGGQLVCLDATGTPIWASGTDRFGLGPFLVADGVILAMSDGGILSAIEATPASYKRIAQARVLEGPEAWGPLALAGTRLLARDVHKMVCLELGRK
jgi:outer membrane protein assembly factor BamB